MRVVLDANTMASGAVAPTGGTLATVVESWQAGLFTVVLSAHLLGELERAFADPYFTKRLSPEDIAAYLRMVRPTATITPLTEEVHGVATHPEDDLVVATAVSSQVDYLVTGDTRLQRLGTFRGVTILSPRAFVELLARSQTH